LLLCGTFYAGLYEFAPQRWYAMQNDVPSERVYIQRKPDDCEWMSAPLGDKPCHYEKSVRKLSDPEQDPQIEHDPNKSKAIEGCVKTFV
jgi:hypothetical protein